MLNFGYFTSQKYFIFNFSFSSGWIGDFNSPQISEHSYKNKTIVLTSDGGG